HRPRESPRHPARARESWLPSNRNQEAGARRLPTSEFAILTGASQFKWGVSGGPLNAAGVSARAAAQVSALNRAAGGAFTYESSIVRFFPAGPGSRAAALSLEKQLVYDYKSLTGAKPIGNIRP